MYVEVSVGGDEGERGTFGDAYFHDIFRMISLYIIRIGKLTKPL